MPAAVIEIPDGQHSPVGPSAGKRWINCTRSVAASKGLPDIPSIFALTGTAAHTVSQWCREQRVGAEKFLGTTIRIDGKHDIMCDQAMVDSVNTFCEYVYDLGGEMFFEQRVHYEEYVPSGFGTSDHIAVTSPEVAHIVDFKDGEGVQVWAEWEPQLLLYALGFWLEYGWLYTGLKKFVLHICQPRLQHIDRWEVSLEDLLAWAISVAKPAAGLALAGRGEFKAGPWCQFCLARFTCTARARQVLSILSNPDGSTLDSSKLTDDQVDKILHMLPLLRQLMADVKSYATRQISSGQPIGSWKLVGGRSSRTFNASASVVGDVCGVTTDELYRKEMLSVAQFEEKIGKKKFKEYEWLVVTKKPGAPTLAPGDDRREAIKTLDLGGFTSLEPNEAADFLDL